MFNVVNTYCPSTPVISQDGGLSRIKPELILMAVLTQDEAKQYACYVALVPNPERAPSVQAGKALEEQNAQAVARFGAKLRYAEIATYFRGIKPEEYRA